MEKLGSGGTASFQTKVSNRPNVNLTFRHELFVVWTTDEDLYLLILPRIVKLVKPIFLNSVVFFIGKFSRS